MVHPNSIQSLGLRKIGGSERSTALVKQSCKSILGVILLIVTSRVIDHNRCHYLCPHSQIGRQKIKTDLFSDIGLIESLQLLTTKTPPKSSDSYLLALKHLQEFTGLDNETILKNQTLPYGFLTLLSQKHPFAEYARTQFNRNDFVFRFPLHEGIWYALEIKKQLGKFPKQGIPIINFDSHDDRFSNQLGSDGVDDANWGYAVVRDGLAPFVLQIALLPHPSFTLIESRDESHSLSPKWRSESLPSDELVPILQRLIKTYLTDTSFYWVTFDLDFVSLKKSLDVHSPTGWHLDPTAVREVIAKIVLPFLQMFDCNPSQLIIADSLDYLAPPARQDASYRSQIIQYLTEMIYQFCNRPRLQTRTLTLRFHQWHAFISSFLDYNSHFFSRTSVVNTSL